MEISEITIEDPVETARTHLSNIKSNWAAHIKKDHLGYVATSCHKCINFKNNINFAEDDLFEAKKEKESKKMPFIPEGQH